MTTADDALAHWVAARDALSAGNAQRATEEAEAARRAEAAAKGMPFDETFGNPAGEVSRVTAILQLRNNVLHGVPDEHWDEMRQETAFSVLLGVHPDQAPVVALFGRHFTWPRFDEERVLFQAAAEFPALWAGLEGWSDSLSTEAAAVFAAFGSLPLDARRVLVYNSAIGREVVRGTEDAQRRCYLESERFAVALGELEARGLGTARLSVRQRLMLRTVKELRSLAQEMGLPKSGRKADLAKRLADHDAEACATSLADDGASDHVWLCLDIPKAAKTPVSQRRKLLHLLGHHLVSGATTEARTAQSADLDMDLVQLDVHHDACSLCRRVQGKVFSLRGQSADFPAISEASYPPIHIGCRHTLLAMVEEFMERDAPRAALSRLSHSDRTISSYEDRLRALVEFGAPPALAAGRDAELTEKLTERLEQVDDELGAWAAWEWREQEYYVSLRVPYGEGWDGRFPASVVHRWLDGESDEFWQRIVAAARGAQQDAGQQQDRSCTRGPLVIRAGSQEARSVKPGGCLVAVAAAVVAALRGLWSPLR